MPLNNKNSLVSLGAEASESKTAPESYRKFLLIAFCFPFSALCLSCEFLEIDPPKTQIVGASVFTNDGSATGAVTGIYSTMMQAQGFASINVTWFAGLSSDELADFTNSTAYVQIYTNAILPTNSNVQSLWTTAYKSIYAANAVIEGLTNSTRVTDSVKKQLEGEAKFIRAFGHFYLVNFFGDVPYINSTDYVVNAAASRLSKAQVYQQIIVDLKDAQNLLGDNYISVERVRPNKWAATALLSRVYLYTQDWINAEAQASAVINNTAQYSLVTNLNNVFLKNSTEAILQLMPVRPGFNTNEGSSFILQPGQFPGITALSNQTPTAFETGDNRRSTWIDSTVNSGQTYYYPFKYKVRVSTTITEYYMVLRLAEQYLIRAEARVQQNNISGAVADLNVIRTRAGLGSLPSTLTQAQCLTAIEQERRVELFCEWGHRWLDLNRTGRADAVLGAVKTGWQPADALYPIPQTEIQNNPNLTQNPGY